MDFQEIKQEFQKISPSSNIKFNLSIFDDDVTRYLKNYIKFYYKNILYLWRAEYIKLSENVINLSGDFEVKLTDTYFKINIYVHNNSNLDYYITVQPRANWINEIGSDIKSFIGKIPVNIDFQDTLFIYSSNKIEKVLLTYGDRYERSKYQFEHSVQSGFQVAAKVKSELLAPLNLPNDLFLIDEKFNIFKQLNYKIKLANILDININELRIKEVDVLNLNGDLKLNFPNNEDLNLKCLFAITPQNYQSRIQLEDIKLPVQYFLKGLNISNVAVDISGSLINLADFNFGIMGDFSIGDSSPNVNVHDFSYASLNSNEFILKFKPSTSSYIPVFIQAYIEELSMSKAITLITANDINLPDFIDPIKLYSTYLYYCSPNENNILLNGVKANKGVAISSGIKILELDAYCEYSAIENEGTSGRVLIEPISIGNILSIGGDSDGTPDGYTGPEIKKDGVELFFDSNGPEYLGTSAIKVNLLDILIVNGKANYGVKGLEFEGRIVAGPINIKANCQFRDLNYFSLGSYMRFDALGFDVDFGDLGNLSVHLRVECDIRFELINSKPSAEFSLAFNFNGKAYSLVSVGFSFEDISNLELLVYNTIKKMIENLLKIDPLEWLKALINEVIKFGTDVINESIKIANILVNNFGQSVKDSAVLLDKAGYEIGKIGSILADGFIQNVEQIASIFKELNYSTEEIVNELYNKFKQSAEKIAIILKELQYEIKELASVLKNILKVGSNSITNILNNIGYGAEDVAVVLKDVYGLTKGPVRELLKSIGHIGSVADDVLGGLFETVSGGSCLVSGNDVFQLSLQRRNEAYKLIALRDYKDNVMMKTTEGEGFLESYYEMSDNILNSLDEIETVKFLEDVYHQIIIKFVALIERKQNERINNFLEEKIISLNKLYLNQ